MAETTSIAAYPGGPDATLKDYTTLQSDQLTLQNKALTNTGLGLSNDYKTQQNAEATRINAENQRQADSAARLRAAQAKVQADQASDQTTQPDQMAQTPQPPQTTPPPQAPTSIGAAQIPAPALPSPTASPIPTVPQTPATSTPSPTDLVHAKLRAQGTATDPNAVAANAAAQKQNPAMAKVIDANPSDLHPDSVMAGKLSPTDQAVYDAYRQTDPADAEAFKQKKLADDRAHLGEIFKLAIQQREDHVGKMADAMGDLYRTKVRLDAGDLKGAQAAWTQDWDKHQAQYGADAMVGIPRLLPNDINAARATYDGVNSQLETAAQRSTDALNQTKVLNEKFLQNAQVKNLNAETASHLASAEKTRKETELLGAGAGTGTAGPNAIGSEYFKGLAPVQQNEAIQGAEGKLPPIMFRGKEGQARMDMVGRAFPGHDPIATYNFMSGLGKDSSGQPGMLKASAVRMTNHVGEALDVLPNLPTSNSLGPISGALNYGIGKATDNPYISKWNVVSQGLLEELAKLQKGGVSGAEELARNIKNMPWNARPDVKLKALQGVAALGIGQTQALESQRATLLQERDPGTSLMTPKNQGIIKRLYMATGDQPPKLLPPEVNGQGDYNDLDVGAPYKYRDVSGNWLTGVKKAEAR